MAGLGETLMNFSLWTADRATHVKVVALALVAATIVIAVGVRARISDPAGATARVETNGPAVKAGKPTQITISDGNAVR
jgi:hypothetical protein